METFLRYFGPACEVILTREPLETYELCLLLDVISLYDSRVIFLVC